MKHELLIDNSKISVFAKIMGVIEYREFIFIIDTGATKSIIDEKVVERLGFDLNHLDSGYRLMTAGGNVNSKTLKLPKFSLFGKDIADFEVNVIKMPLQISYFADGLVGMDFLLQFERLQFDFTQKIVETFD